MKQIAENNPEVEPPGHSWLSDILKRETGIKQLMPSNLETARADAFNMDETFICAKDRRMHVIVPKEAKRAPMDEGGHFNHHMTLVMCIAADGTAPRRPTVILPLKTVPVLPDEVATQFEFAGSESGICEPQEGRSDRETRCI